MSWDDIGYSVRPADPQDRRASLDAHEVVMENGEKVLRVVGVWATRRDATAVRDALAAMAPRQIR